MCLFLLLLLALPLSSTASNDTLVWCHQTVSGWAWSEAEAVAMLENEDYLRVTDVAVLQHRRIKRRSVAVGQDAHDDEPLYFHFQGRQGPAPAPGTMTAMAPSGSAPSPQSDTVMFHLLLMGLFVCMASLGAIFWMAITAYLQNQLEDKEYLLRLEEEYLEEQAMKAVMAMEEQMEQSNPAGQEQDAQAQYISQDGQGQYIGQEVPGENNGQADHGQDNSQAGQEPVSNQVEQGQYSTQGGQEPINSQAGQGLYYIQGSPEQFTGQNAQDEQNTEEGLPQYAGEETTVSSAELPASPAPSSTASSTSPTTPRPETTTRPITTTRATTTRSTTTLGPGERKINPLFLKGLSSQLYVDNNRRSDDDIGSDVTVLRQFPPFQRARSFPASGAVFVLPSPSVPYKYSFRVSVTLVNSESCDSRSSCSVYSSLWSTNTAKEANLKADAPVQCTFQCQTENCYQSGKR